jgi:hypothetical protein
MAVSPQHATLVGSTVATMTFDEDFAEMEIMNVTGTSAVYVRFDGVAPVVAAAGTHVVPAIAGATIIRKPKTSGASVVKFISAGTPVVSARGIVD